MEDFNESLFILANLVRTKKCEMIKFKTIQS